MPSSTPGAAAKTRHTNSRYWSAALASPSPAMSEYIPASKSPDCVHALQRSRVERQISERSTSRPENAWYQREVRHDSRDAPEQSLGAVLLPVPASINFRTAAVGDGDPDGDNEGQQRDAGKRDGGIARQVGTAWRKLGGKARAELDRRGYGPLPPEYDGPRTAAGDLDLVAWWREFEADIDRVEKAIDRERRAALDEGRPWPPLRQPEPASASGAEVPESVPEAGDDTRADPEPAPAGTEDPQARTPGDPSAARTASSRDAQPPPPSPDPDYVPWSAWQPGPEDEADAGAEDEADVELADGTVDTGNEAGIEPDVEGNEADVEPDKEPDPDPGQAPDRQAERVAALNAQLDELSAGAHQNPARHPAGP